jgi:MFS family permease
MSPASSAPPPDRSRRGDGAGPPPDARRRRVLGWRGLALGVLGQTTATIVLVGPSFLIPLLRDAGYSLTLAGTAAASTSFGMVLTLVAWGALADRRGERLVIAAGLLGAAAITGLGVVLSRAGMLVHPLSLICLLALAGAACASVNSATGRVVAGWFSRERRGLAMGIRQMSQPLGTGIAAVTVPAVAALWGITGFLVLAAVLAAVSGAACWAGVVDPPRPARAEVEDPDDLPTGAPASVNPYCGDSFLLRIHAVSALLVIPQFTFMTYGLVWLMDVQRMEAHTAGLVVGVAQLVGAAGRIVMGGLSDRAPSRMFVLRIVALAAAVLTGAVAATSLGVMPVLGAVVLVLASAASVADNGLAFTSIAEAAGSRWSGKALGIQNTGQHLVSSGVGPVVGALVTAAGYPLALACVAGVPVVASLLVPRKDVERD